MKNNVDLLIRQMEDIPFWSFCQLLSIVRWQMY